MSRPSQVRTVTGLDFHSESVDAILLCVKCLRHAERERVQRHRDEEFSEGG